MSETTIHSSETTLRQLRDDLAARCSERVAALKQAHEERLRALEREHQQRLTQELERREQTLRGQLERLRTQAQRDTQEAAHRLLWSEQQACIDEIVGLVRKALAAQEPDPAQVRAWVAASLDRLGGATEYRLIMNTAWADSLQAEALPLSRQPMLGGVILEVPGRHLQVDGSWDRRLPEQVPALWERWIEHVRKDRQD